MSERSRTNPPRTIARTEESVSSDSDAEIVGGPPPGEASGEPPVVARLVVEVRSDGRVTVARGAMEDVSGGKVAIEARGDSPLSLALSLARQMFRMPRLARRASRALLPGRRRR